MDKKIISLIEDYQRGNIGRRNFLKKLTLYAGSAAAAMSFLPFAEEKISEPNMIPDDGTGYLPVQNQVPGSFGAKGRTLVVSQKHPKASDKNSGTVKAPFKTINAAAQLAEPGDTVLVYTGIYRERVAPARGGEEGKPIIYMAAPGEAVEIRGSEIWSPQWTPVADHEGVYSGKLEMSMFRTGAPEGAVQEFNPYTIKHQELTNRTVGQVFVNGAFLTEMEMMEDVFALPGSWKTDGQSVTIHFPRPYALPAGYLVELSVRGRIFAPYKRGLGYIHVRGFEMSHCANNGCEGFYNRGSEYPQAGALGCRGGHHWLIEGNSLRWANGVGIDCGTEGAFDLDGLKQPSSREAGNHVIRNNIISDNGAAGIVGLNPRATHILGNTLERNHYLGYHGMESAGIKLHSLNGGIIEGNLIRDTRSYGIWLDNGARGTRITRNIFIRNMGAGLFLELGGGPTLVDNNIFALTVMGDGMPGDGLYSHDASGITVAHNLFWFNAHFGVWAHIGRASEVRQSASKWNIMNNVIVGNSFGAISLPTVTDRSKDNFSDRNLIAASYNLMTSETWGAEMDQPFFLRNGNKGMTGIDELATLFSNAMDTVNLPSGERPNLTTWKKVPYLTLDQWRLWTGWDRNSLVPVLLRPEMKSTDIVELLFLIDDSPVRLGCKPVEGVDKDFFGQPIKANGTILPGPFQTMSFEPAFADHKTYATPYRGDFEKIKSTKQNLNRLLLWPMRQSEVYAPAFLAPQVGTTQSNTGGTPPNK